MDTAEQVEIVLLSSGHTALDHRVFDKEAITLAQHFPRVRVVAAHGLTEMREMVQITPLPPTRSRFKRFLFRPLQCFLQACGAGERTIILHDAELLLWVPLVKVLTRWRVVYDVHEDFSQLLLRRSWIPKPVRKWAGWGVGVVEKLFARCCDGVMGATTVLVDHFSPLPRVALYNLPSRDFLATTADAARPVEEREYDLVHLGTLSAERLEFLCAVFEEIAARKPDVRALVIGVEPDQRARLHRQFAEEQVTVLGKVGYDRIAGYLGNCRIGVDVHPVLYPHLRCAVPVKVFEYMAAGCNVITSFLPELHRLLGEEGAEHVVTIDIPSAVAFAEQAIHLLDGPDFMRDHQAALQRLVRTRWNWEHEAEKLVEFITFISHGEERVSREKGLRW